jgi:hypothetical protein
MALPNPSEPLLVNQETVAAWLGITTRHVRSLEAKGLPRATRKRAVPGYRWADVLSWWMDYRREAASPGSDPEASADLELRKLRADVQAREHELAELRAPLVHRDVMVEVVGEAFARVREELEGIPERWAPDLIGMGTPRDVHTALRPLAQAEVDRLREANLEGPREEAQ